MDYIASRDLYICVDCGNTIPNEFFENIRDIMEVYQCSSFILPKLKNEIIIERLDWYRV